MKRHVLKQILVFRWLLYASICLGLIAPLPVKAQQSRGGGQFSRVTQLLNTQLPNVNIFDSNGQPLSTATLKGSYTVLVFGCLT